MRIPTVIIVSDDNDELMDIAQKLLPKVRLYFRTSLQGEQLYGIREGVLYFDHRGDRQLTLQDDYSRVTAMINTKLELIDELSRNLLEAYLERQKNKYTKHTTNL